jgi:hypothetical protein
MEQDNGKEKLNHEMTVVSSMCFNFLRLLLIDYFRWMLRVESGTLRNFDFRLYKFNISVERPSKRVLNSFYTSAI